MFNSILGRVSGHDFPLVYVTTGGVEWELEVSATTFQQVVAADREQEHRFLLHMYVREDAMKLFGFWTGAERRAFRELLRVPGIGPRQATRILSGTTVPALTTLLEQEDIDALTRIPGLGRKTAQKMILQLKGHLVTDDGTGGGSASAPREDELLAALVEMGFDRVRARETLRELRGDEGSGEPDEQDVFRRAIVALSGS